MKTKSSDSVYGVGIDTGGTYTDAVLFDLREHL
jgi:N-methylhydantoinase A/oxoprolinase/acetone carboxylase beta subunit